jgi:methylthioribose-1-phosphate isomerase
MSKHIFSKIAKIGEEVRSAEPMKVELFDAKEAAVDRDKAANGAYAAYQMIQKAKTSAEKSIFAADSYISKYVKELQKWPTNSPTAIAYKKAIDAMKVQKKQHMDFLALIKKFPTY